MKKTVKYAIINSLVTALYVVFIASLIYFLGQTLGAEKTVLAPIAMLMLFVFSAAFTGVMVFGRPILWYMDNKKKEALSLLFYTLGIFLIITIFVFGLLVMIGML